MGANWEINQSKDNCATDALVLLVGDASHNNTIVGVLLFIYLLKIYDTVPTLFSELLKNVLQAPPIEPLDSQLSLDDLDVIKVIGKGSSGNVQLVRHKFTGQFFALKVFLTQSFFDAAYLWFFTVKTLERSLHCTPSILFYLSRFSSKIN
jgi:hypothetical protein